MTIHINRDLEDAAQFEAQRIYENLAPDGSTLSAERSCTLSEGQTPEDYAALAGRPVLTLAAETESGGSVPIQGTYTKVEAVSVSYSELSGLYVATVIFS